MQGREDVRRQVGAQHPGPARTWSTCGGVALRLLQLLCRLGRSCRAASARFLCCSLGCGACCSASSHLALRASLRGKGANAGCCFGDRFRDLEPALRSTNVGLVRLHYPRKMSSMVQHRRTRTTRVVSPGAAASCRRRVRSHRTCPLTQPMCSRASNPARHGTRCKMRGCAFMDRASGGALEVRFSSL